MRCSRLHFPEQGVELVADGVLDRHLQRRQQERKPYIELDVVLAHSHLSGESRPLERNIVTVPGALEIEALVKILGDLLRSRFGLLVLELVPALNRNRGHGRPFESVAEV